MNSNIKDVIKELSCYHRNKDDLYLMYVQNRLNKTVLNYEHELNLLLSSVSIKELIK